MAGRGPVYSTQLRERGAGVERQLGTFFAAAFDSAQSAAFDSVCLQYGLKLLDNVFIVVTRTVHGKGHQKKSTSVGLCVAHNNNIVGRRSSLLLSLTTILKEEHIIIQHRSHHINIIDQHHGSIILRLFLPLHDLL